MSFPIRYAIAGAVLAVAAPALAQSADPARATVQTLDDGLIAIMKGGSSLGMQGRISKIGPVVDQTFDIPLITRLSVGPDWTRVAPADQTALVAAMRRMTVSQYATNFSSWAGHSITIDPAIETRGSDKLVRTSLSAPKDSPVAIAYRLRQSGGKWRVIDVYYRNAISQLATRRADFASVFAKGGAKALMAHLDALAAKSGR